MRTTDDMRRNRPLTYIVDSTGLVVGQVENNNSLPGTGARIKAYEKLNSTNMKDNKR